MSLIKEAWDSLRTVALLVDKLETHDTEIKALAADLRDARERLVAVETIIAYARSSAPSLPPR